MAHEDREVARRSSRVRAGRLQRPEAAVEGRVIRRFSNDRQRRATFARMNRRVERVPQWTKTAATVGAVAGAGILATRPAVTHVGHGLGPLAARKAFIAKWWPFFAAYGGA